VSLDNALIGTAQMLLDHAHSAVSIAGAERVNDLLMRSHYVVPEVRIGYIAVEEQDVDLRPQSSPAIVQTPVMSSLVDEIVEADV
jgi:hypothetical protein